MPLVQRLRLRYGPLAELIPPHITVVFPFEAALKPGTFRTLLEEQRAFLPIAFELGICGYRVKGWPRPGSPPGPQPIPFPGQQAREGVCRRSVFQPGWRPDVSQAQSWG